ncbi:MAG: aldo/keto reductase [Myxococcota bacterium]
MLPVGLGCMRLSTDAERDRERALATLRAAREAGVTLFDTAAAYGHGERDRHHNEELLAEAFEDRAGLTLVTKAGMARRGRGAKAGWLPDGRRKALFKDAERSARVLGPPDLLLLHAPDPRTPLATSARALAALEKQGLALAVGLANVTRTQLDQARDHMDVAAVQVALSPFDDEAAHGGVVARAQALGIPVLAHSPLGGPARRGRAARDEELAFLAEARGTTAETLVLAWLRSLGVVPLPGARRPETARLAGHAARLVLRDDERALLDERFPVGALLRTPKGSRRPRAPRGEVVLFVGLPAAGKSTRAKALEGEGYLRLSRDERGGSLAGLAQALGETLDEGAGRVLLDATHPTRAQRSRVVETAWSRGAGVRCLWLKTELGEARKNAVARMLQRYGEVLGPEAMKAAQKTDPTAFPPRAQQRYLEVFEPPQDDEGFEAIDVVPFDRPPRPGTRRGLLVELAQLAPRFPGPLALEALEAAEADAVLVFGWVPGVDAEAAREAFAPAAARGAELALCAHEAGPLRCWCRPPLPGLVLPWLLRHDVGALVARTTSAGGRALAESFGASVR